MQWRCAESDQERIFTMLPIACKDDGIISQPDARQWSCGQSPIILSATPHDGVSSDGHPTAEAFSGDQF
jgi:hypothetical protein